MDVVQVEASWPLVNWDSVSFMLSAIDRTSPIDEDVEIDDIQSACHLLTKLRERFYRAVACSGLDRPVCSIERTYVVCSNGETELVR